MLDNIDLVDVFNDNKARSVVQLISYTQSSALSAEAGMSYFM
jgi:hypothetical protein